MQNFGAWMNGIVGGNNKLLFVVAAFHIFLLLYVVCVHIFLQVRDNARGMAFERLHGTVVKCRIKSNLFSGLITVYSVNNEAPVIWRTFTKYGYYLLSGQNEIHVQYSYQPFWANLVRKVAGATHLFGIKQVNDDDKKLLVMAERNKEYILHYDKKRKKYIFEPMEMGQGHL